MTNNFSIPRDLFLQIQFDDSLKQYGHEDTLFGLELAAQQIPIQHIDAPLEHLGLEPANVFLHKTRQGLENLYALWSQGKRIDTKLLRYFIKIEQWRLSPLLALIFQWCSVTMEKHLCSTHPSMRVFDCYKLCCLCDIHQKKGSLES